MSITAPSPLVRLDAPLPTPRRYTLLDAADLQEASAERWEGGAWVNAYPSAPASVQDPCSTGTGRTKAIDADHSTEMQGAFTVYLGGSCTGRSLGSGLDWYRERLTFAFRAVEATAVERVLVSGDGLALGPYLGDSDMETLGSGAVSPTEGLALLEDAISAVGNGMIHVAPRTATYWASAYLIEADRGGVMRTRLGTVVAVGAGYRDARPDGKAGNVADREWAFASGPVQVFRGADDVLPANYAQAIDRSSNEVVLIAERTYLLSWVGRQDSSDDNHIQAGVLIDRIP